MKRDFRCRSTKTEFENVMRASFRSNGNTSQSGSDRNVEVRVSKGNCSCKEFKNLGGRVHIGVTSRAHLKACATTPYQQVRPGRARRASSAPRPTDVGRLAMLRYCLERPPETMLQTESGKRVIRESVTSATSSYESSLGRHHHCSGLHTCR